MAGICANPSNPYKLTRTLIPCKTDREQYE
jgi:hypothetical protein